MLLTDEEIESVWIDLDLDEYDYHGFARAIEAEIMQRVQHLELYKSLAEEYGLSVFEDIAMLRRQLTESQAREVKLREAFELQRRDKWHWEEIRDKALALPQDDTALREMTQKASECMRARCIAIGVEEATEAFTGDAEEWGRGVVYYSELIQTIPGVTLEDLQK